MRSSTCQLANEAILDATDGHEAMHLCVRVFAACSWRARPEAVTDGEGE